MFGKVSKLFSLINPVAEKLGLEVVGIEEQRSRKHGISVRVFIDKPPSGVTLHDCEQLSLQLKGVFAVYGKFDKDYHLEVSSPGVERLIFNVEQLKTCLGKEVFIELLMPVDNRHRFTGTVLSMTEDMEAVALEVDSKAFVLPIDKIKKVKLLYHF